MVLGDQLSQRPHVGDGMLCHVIGARTQPGLAGAGNSYPSLRFVLGAVGWVLQACAWGSLAYGCARGCLHWITFASEHPIPAAVSIQGVATTSMLKLFSEVHPANTGYRFVQFLLNVMSA